MWVKELKSVISSTTPMMKKLDFKSLSVIKSFGNCGLEDFSVKQSIYQINLQWKNKLFETDDGNWYL